MTVRYDISAGSMWIVDSLPQPGQLRTGELLHEHVEPLAISQGLACARRRVDTRREFEAVLREVAAAAARGLFLHIEAHGSPEGLELASGEFVSWNTLADLLRPICARSGLHLVVTVAACFGAAFTSQLQATGPAPFLVLFGPNKKIDAGEIERGTRAFYTELLSSRLLKPAWTAMNRAIDPSKNSFAAVPAEAMFKLTCRGYIQVHCTPRAIEARVRAIEATARRTHSRPEVRRRRKTLIAYLSDYRSAIARMRSAFYYCDQWPGNDRRFESVEQILQGFERQKRHR
jgi:hypothetical protein